MIIVVKRKDSSDSGSSSNDQSLNHDMASSLDGSSVRKKINSKSIWKTCPLQFICCSIFRCRQLLMKEISVKRYSLIQLDWSFKCIVLVIFFLFLCIDAPLFVKNLICYHSDFKIPFVLLDGIIRVLSLPLSLFLFFLSFILIQCSRKRGSVIFVVLAVISIFFLAICIMVRVDFGYIIQEKAFNFDKSDPFTKLDSTPLGLSIFLISPTPWFLNLVVSLIPFFATVLIHGKVELIHFIGYLSIWLVILFIKYFEDRMFYKEYEYSCHLRSLFNGIIKEKKTCLEILELLVPKELILHFQNEEKVKTVLKNVYCVRIYCSDQENSTRNAKHEIERYYVNYLGFSDKMDRIAKLHGMFRLKGPKNRITYISREVTQDFVVRACQCSLEMKKTHEEINEDSKVMNRLFLVCNGKFACGIDVTDSNKLRFLECGLGFYSLLEALRKHEKLEFGNVYTLFPLIREISGFAEISEDFGARLYFGDENFQIVELKAIRCHNSNDITIEKEKKQTEKQKEIFSNILGEEKNMDKEFRIMINSKNDKFKKDRLGRFKDKKIEKSYRKWNYSRNAKESRVVICLFLDFIIHSFSAFAVLLFSDVFLNGVFLFSTVQLPCMLLQLIFLLGFGIHNRCRCFAHLYLFLNIVEILGWGVIKYSNSVLRINPEELYQYLDIYFYYSFCLVFQTFPLMSLCWRLAYSFLYFISWSAIRIDYNGPLIWALFQILSNCGTFLVLIVSVSKAISSNRSTRKIYFFSNRVTRMKYLLQSNRTFNKAMVLNSLPGIRRISYIENLISSENISVNSKWCGKCIMIICSFEWCNEEVDHLKKLEKICFLNENLERLIDSNKLLKNLNLEILCFLETKLVLLHYIAHDNEIMDCLQLILKIRGQILLIPDLNVRIAFSLSNDLFVGAYGNLRNSVDVFSDVSTVLEQFLNLIQISEFRNRLFLILGRTSKMKCSLYDCNSELSSDEENHCISGGSLNSPTSTSPVKDSFIMNHDRKLFVNLKKYFRIKTHENFGACEGRVIHELLGIRSDSSCERERELIEDRESFLGRRGRTFFNLKINKFLPKRN